MNLSQIELKEEKEGYFNGIDDGHGSFSLVILSPFCRLSEPSVMSSLPSPLHSLLSFYQYLLSLSVSGVRIEEPSIDMIERNFENYSAIRK